MYEISKLNIWVVANLEEVDPYAVILGILLVVVPCSTKRIAEGHRQVSPM